MDHRGIGHTGRRNLRPKRIDVFYDLSGIIALHPRANEKGLGLGLVDWGPDCCCWWTRLQD